MQIPYHTFKNFAVGLGWKIIPFEDREEKLYFVEGNLFGFATYMGIIPEQDTGVVILYNHGELPPSFLGEAILKVLNKT